MRRGAEAGGHADAFADFYGLDGVDGHDCLGQLTIQPGVPRDMGTQSCRDTAGYDLKAAADSVSFFLGVLNFLHHRLCDVRKDTADDIIVTNGFQLVPGNVEVVRQADFANGKRMAEDLNIKRLQENLRDGACRHAGSGFAGAGPFQDVAGVAVIELERSRQIGVTGTWTRDSPFGRGFGRDFPDGHDFGPVGPVTVFDQHGDRAADRFAVADAGENLDMVSFDFHSSAASISALAALQFVIDKVEVDRQVRGNTFDECNQRLSMRFARRPEPEHVAEYSIRNSLISC